MTQVVI